MRILAFISILIWGGLTWVGVDLVNGVANRHVSGYPTQGQWIYYVIIPSATLSVASGALAIGLFTHFRRTATVVLVVTVGLVIPFVLSYGGGV